MANTNFLQFDSQGTNMLSDESYSSDSQRTAGVSEGLARSALYNKQAFQVSTMVKALADFIVAQGYNAMDNNLTALTNTLKDLLAVKNRDNTFSGNNYFSGVNSFGGSVSFGDTARASITEFGMPNYSAAVSMPSGSQTSSANGFLIFAFPGRAVGYFTIGNYSQSFDYNYNYTQPSWCCFPIKKGQTWDSGGVYVTFVPSIGG